MLWVDLAFAGLIDGNFNTAQETTDPGSSVTNIMAWFPPAKIGSANYIYAWGCGIHATATCDGSNYWGISAVTKIETGPCVGCLNSTPGLTVQQAYNIDKKTDDGLPQSGKITAIYFQEWPEWAAGGGALGASTGGLSPTTAATPGSATTCYDNGNTNGVVQQYSISQNGGNGINCALSFQFQ